MVTIGQTHHDEQSSIATDHQVYSSRINSSSNSCIFVSGSWFAWPQLLKRPHFTSGRMGTFAFYAFFPPSFFPSKESKNIISEKYYPNGRSTLLLPFFHTCPIHGPYPPYTNSFCLGTRYVQHSKGVCGLTGVEKLEQ
jgi:hypothetical protein